MILENLVTFVGALLKHVIGVLMLCWRRMLRAALISFALGVVVTALVVVVATGEAIPSPTSLVVALLFGVALAYGVALTVLVEELVLGAIDLIRILEGDAQAGAHIAEVVAEREVGQVGQGLRRLIGLPVSKRAPRRPGAKLPPLIRTQPPLAHARPPLVRTQPPATGAPVADQPSAQPGRQPEHPPASIAAASLIEAGAALAIKAAAAAALSAAAQHAAPAVSPTTAPSADTPASAPAVDTPAPWPAPDAPASTSSSPAAAVPAPWPTSAPPASESAAVVPSPWPASDAPAAHRAEELGEPVPADRLPRIEWTYEHEAIRPPAAPAPDATPAAEPVAAPSVADAVTPVAEAATPVASEEPLSPPASRDLSNTLAELAGGAAVSAAAHITPTATPTEPAPEPASAPALEASYDDERLAAPADITMPEGPSEPAERADATMDGVDGVEEAPEHVSAEPVEFTSEWATPPDSAAPEAGEEAPETVSAEPVELASEWDVSSSSAARSVVDAPAEAVETADDAGQPPDEGAPSGRSDFSRRTLPLSEGGASLEGSRPGVASGPRPSAPESGLWERLSNALISRTGAPSGPFAPPPPQSPSGDEPATDDTSIREPEPGSEA